MSAGSRMADLFGYSSPLRCPDGVLLPGAYGMDGWTAIAANGFWGGYLTAAADAQNARIRVDLEWPGITSATVERVHADGTSYQVRGGDPATVLTQWARYDYEAPLDQQVYYRATSVERTEAVATSDPVTVSSQGRHWLKSVTNPALNMPVTIANKGNRQAEPQFGKISPPERADSIFVYQVRRADTGVVAVYAADKATADAIRGILAAGGPVMLQKPAVAGGDSDYLMILQSAYDPLVRLTVDMQNAINLPYEVIGRPSGAALGGPGNTYADWADPFDTYGQVSAAATSYLELSMSAF